MNKKREAEWEYECAEERYNEQNYIYNELKTAIQCIEEYCEDSQKRDDILDELNDYLESAEAVLLDRKAELAMADQKLRLVEMRRFYDFPQKTEKE